MADQIRKDFERGIRAQKLLESDEWVEAWTAYRVRILEEIEKAPSDAQERVMHLKRLLTAANAAKGHMERLVKEGALAAKEIELEPRKRFRMFG